MTDPIAPFVRPSAPDAPFARDAAGVVTYAELERRAAAVAAQLDELAPGPVVLACERPARFAAALWAAWSRDRVVALPVSIRPDALGDVAAAVFAAAILHDGSPASGLNVDTLAASEPGTLEPPRFGSGQVIAIVHTSGSTGDPVPFPKTAGQLFGEVAMLASSFGLTDRDVVASTVPPHHIYGLLFGVLLPLRVGASVVARPGLHPEAVAETIRRHRVSVLVSVPAHLRSLVMLERLPPVARVFCSGAPLPEATADALHDRLGLVITEVFGSTETGGIATRRSDGPRVWQPLAGVDIAADDAGHLQVDSPFLPPGVARPLRCADRVELVERGFVHCGRADDVVKVAGTRVSLGAVEAALGACQGVCDAAVVVLDDAARGQRLAALVVLTGDKTIEDVRHELARAVDPHALPRPIRAVATIPRSATGKLARAQMLGLVASAPDRVDLGPLETTADGFAREVEVPRTCALFEGHFPGQPILPGVAELTEIVLPTIAQAWPGLGGPRRVTRLKFKQTIAPGDRLRVSVRFDATNSRASFTIERGGERCASGNLTFGDHRE